MDWSTVLSQKALQDRGEGLLKSFLLAAMPPFEAPVDSAAWQARVPGLRRRALEEVFLKGFPAGLAERPPRVVWGRTLRPDSAYAIRKLRYEIHPGYWIPALLYEPTRPAGRMPVVLNPNGHHAGGKAVEYKQIRCANLARRGVLALNLEFIGMGELRGDACHNNIALLNLTGMAGVGLFYLALSKGLDILLAQPNLRGSGSPAFREAAGRRSSSRRSTSGSPCAHQSPATPVAGLAWAAAATSATSSRSPST
jgi:hypothetical protein